jgi:SAM-dependent methyltransferase
MLPRPDHLGPAYGAQFQDPSVVAAYRHRPPYPDEIFDILTGLIVGGSGNVLDLGTGTGAIARGLVGRVARVDAIDPSRGMIEAGRGLPGGDHPNLTWVEGHAEDAPLRPPYGLVTAGASLHWMDGATVLPRVRDALVPGGVLAIVDEREPPQPWDAALKGSIGRFSTNRAYRPYDLIEELESRGLFRRQGRLRTAPTAFARTVADYVESLHARNGLSRDRMTVAAASAFDREVAALVRPQAVDGVLALRVAAEVTWGLPTS